MAESGQDGQGTLSLAGGATLSTTSTRIGVGSGIFASASIASGASWINTGDLVVGELCATAHLMVYQNATVSSNWGGSSRFSNPRLSREWNRIFLNIGMDVVIVTSP